MPPGLLGSSRVESASLSATPRVFGLPKHLLHIRGVLHRYPTHRVLGLGSSLPGRGSVGLPWLPV